MALIIITVLPSTAVFFHGTYRGAKSVVPRNTNTKWCIKKVKRRRRSSVNFGEKTFLHDICMKKINTMPELNMISARTRSSAIAGRPCDAKACQG